MHLINKEYLLAHKEKLMKYGIIALVVIIAFCVFLARPGEKDTANLIQQEEVIDENIEEDPGMIVVDIAGAVANPQVVFLDAGSRIEDAIVAAGGLLDDADVSQVNRAAILTDGEKVYIPSTGEEYKPLNQESVSSGTGKVNLNTATKDELETLKGVGPVTADKIITYRSTYGPFTSIEDVKNVDGIGEKTFDGFKDQITI